LSAAEYRRRLNRIAATTEFNTKTLLNGTMGALVSIDDFTKVQASVVGNVGKGGNSSSRPSPKPRASSRSRKPTSSPPRRRATP